MANSAWFVRHGLNGQNKFQVNTSQAAFGANIVITDNMIQIGNSTANAFINTTALFAGNSTVNVNLSGAQLKLSNATNIANLDPVKLAIGISTLNSIALSIGSNVQITALAIVIGNSTALMGSNSTVLQVTNTSSNVLIQPGQITIGANVTLGTVSLLIGNSTVNALSNSVINRFRDTVYSTNVTSDGISVGNSSVTSVVNTAGFHGNGAGLTGVVPGAAGSNTQVQWNDSGFTNASAAFVFNKSGNNLTISNTITAAIYNTSSDERLKYLHYQLTDADVANVLHIPVWQYELKSSLGQTKIGVVAQEVQKFLPHAVTKGDDGFLAVNFDMLTSAMLAYLRHLNKRVEDLELEVG